MLVCTCRCCVYGNGRRWSKNNVLDHTNWCRIGHSVRRSVGRGRPLLCRAMARCRCGHPVGHELMPQEVAISTVSPSFRCTSSGITRDARRGVARVLRQSHQKKSVSSMIALRSVDGTLFLGSEKRLHKVPVLDLMLERGPRCV